MLALYTSLFEILLEYPPCEVCEAGRCDDPIGIDATGFPTWTLAAAVVWWPLCPRKWDERWIYCGEELRPAEVMRWHCEIGTHRRSVSAGAARLFREYTRLRDLPAQLRQSRVLEEERLKRGNR